MTRLLASVRTPDEARHAIAGGADIVDLKEPAEGALGRLSDATIAAIRHALAGHRPTSATIGDLTLAPAPVLAAVRAMAATGVDIVKLGMFDGDAAATVAALRAAARDGIRLVAVLFADRAFDFSLLARCADAGFYGVMLDTADKAAGPLTRHLAEGELAQFIAEGRRHRLLVGLAGSLSARDVPRLLPLRPDYLGFRSALTTGGRDAPLDSDAVARLRALLDASPQPDSRDSHSKATAMAGAASAIRDAVSPSCARTSRSKPR
ncbi:MAG TPA: (5-formylfuran-3-yl)methyl phosphate synthase [Stellaceae bacterium]|nr:(5-formylfuran-3-yl)methyl phosphate synthase [Stellaceae bacterium]